MKKISLLVLLNLFFIIPNFIYPQRLTGRLILSPVMPSLISEWETNTGLVCVNLNNSSNSTITISMEGTLYDITRNSAQVASFKTTQSQVSQGLNTMCGFEVISRSAVEFKSSFYINTAGATGRIPEGNYRLCITIKPEKAESFELCSEFLVIIPDPVNLILPMNGDTLSSGTLPEFIWTPVLSTGIKPDIVNYTLKVVPVFEGQSLKDAIDKNPVIFTGRSLSNTAYQYLPSDPPFALYPAAKSFAWQVKALNADGTPATRNDGLSEPRWFHFRADEHRELPSGPRSQIDTSIKNWNKFYGTNYRHIAELPDIL